MHIDAVIEFSHVRTGIIWIWVLKCFLHTRNCEIRGWKYPKNAPLLPGNAKTAGTIRQTSTRGPEKTDFHWRKGACQAPHCCYKSTPAFTSCVDNIPTVCTPQPLFSLLRLLVGLQPKHGPLFIGPGWVSITAALPFASLWNKDNMFSPALLSPCWPWHHCHRIVIRVTLQSSWRAPTSPLCPDPVSFPHLQSTNQTDYYCCSWRLNIRAAPGVTVVTSEHFTHLVFNVP